MVYVIGGLIGLVYGSIIAYINGRLTASYIEKNKDKKNPMQTAASFSATRQIVNAAALLIIFLFHKVLGNYLFPVLIGTLVAMGFVSYFFLFRIGKKQNSAEDE